MRLTPRKNEYEAVVKLLEADGYDDAKSLAKDIVKAVYAELMERDWYAHAWRENASSNLVLAWGPLASPTEVERFAKATHIGGEHRAIKLYSPARQARVDAEQIALCEPVFCARCTHPKGTHENAGFGGRCAVGGCGCQGLQEARAA